MVVMNAYLAAKNKIIKDTEMPFIIPKTVIRIGLKNSRFLLQR
jgi:hypothetical protein